MRRPTWGVLILASLAISACNDDTTGPGSTRPTLDNIWPHEDGRSWTYAFEQESFVDSSAQLYADSTSVPPAPDPTEVDSLLASLPPTNALAQSGVWRLKFDGQITTQSGAQGQNLREGLFAETSTGIRSVSLTDHGPQRLVRALTALHRGARPRKLPTMVEPPLLLAGYAFEQTPDHIGSFGDVDQDLAWLYLDAQLSVGHRFDFQLVPSLANDVFLHAWIAERTTVDTEVGRFAGALRVVYVIDQGVVEMLDERLFPIGYFRPLILGEIYYVPNVGPVQSFERSLLGSDSVLSFRQLIVDKSSNLVGTGVDPALQP